jgi:Bifunctional DNA primase/polymerase, N-terminal
MQCLITSRPSKEALAAAFGCARSIHFDGRPDSDTTELDALNPGDVALLTPELDSLAPGLRACGVLVELLTEERISEALAAGPADNVLPFPAKPGSAGPIVSADAATMQDVPATPVGQPRKPNGQAGTVAKAASPPAASLAPSAKPRMPATRQMTRAERRELEKLAVAYAKKGWKVFPCRNDKSPAYACMWESEATNDPVEVVALLRRHPDGHGARAAVPAERTAGVRPRRRRRGEMVEGFLPARGDRRF